MKCKDLGGACEEVFRAETFEEIANLSKQHAMAMYKSGDQKHIEAMQQMQAIMATEESMITWMNQKKREFEQLKEI